MEELREKIWDYLYRSDAPKLLEEIAAEMQVPVDSVREAVEHEWFKLVADKVTIA